MRWAALLVMALLPSCRDDDLARQPKFETYEAASLWNDGASARPLVAGTVAREALSREVALVQPPPVDAALLVRGQERFGIFCAPCHGPTGRGDGYVVQRGFPAPPSFLSARLRAAPAEHFVDVITQGYGVMYPYDDRVPPADRWAITAYIRALQVADPRAAAEHPARDAVPVRAGGPGSGDGPGSTDPSRQELPKNGAGGVAGAERASDAGLPGDADAR